MSVTRTSRDEFKIEFAVKATTETLGGYNTTLVSQSIELPQIPVAPEGYVWVIELLGIEVAAPLSGQPGNTDSVSNEPTRIDNIFRCFTLGLTDESIGKAWSTVMAPTVIEVESTVENVEDWQETITTRDWPLQITYVQETYKDPNLVWIGTEDFTSKGIATGTIDLPLPVAVESAYAEVEEIGGVIVSTPATDLSLREWDYDKSITVPVNLQVAKTRLARLSRTALSTLKRSLLSHLSSFHVGSACNEHQISIRRAHC